MSSTRSPQDRSLRRRQFFYDHAGFSHRQDEPSWSGRVRAAVLLADAEASLKRSPDARAYWDHDPEPWDGDVEWSGPVWICAIIRDNGETLASLCGIACEDEDLYMRVVEAELASEAGL